MKIWYSSYVIFARGEASRGESVRGRTQEEMRLFQRKARLSFFLHVISHNYQYLDC